MYVLNNIESKIFDLAYSIRTWCKDDDHSMRWKTNEQAKIFSRQNIWKPIETWHL